MSEVLSEPSIADVSTSSLERILDALRAGRLKAPLSRSALVAFGVAGQLEVLSRVLGGHSGPACLTILESVLAERRRHTRPWPELVWSGPEGIHAQARNTAVVLRELFEGARRRVVLAGYSFHDAESVLAPLQRVMVTRGVEAHFFVNIEQPQGAPGDPDAYGRAQLRAFAEENWPFSSPPPVLYCDRRALRPGYGAEFCSMHAKCVSVDGVRALVSSANFTLRAQDRNIETGVLLADPHFATQLERQWMSLIEGEFVLRLG